MPVRHMDALTRPAALAISSAASDGPDPARRRSAIGESGYERRRRSRGRARAMRRRRLKFRVWHRGMREVDLLLGRFADAHLDGMDETATSPISRRCSTCPTRSFSPGCSAGSRSRATAIRRSSAACSPSRTGADHGPEDARAAEINRRLTALAQAPRRGDACRGPGRHGRQGARATSSRATGAPACFRRPRRPAPGRGRARARASSRRRSTWSNSLPGTACPTTASRRTPAIVARRMATLSRLAQPSERPTVVLTTVNAALQRVPARRRRGARLPVGDGRQPDRHGRPGALARGQRLPAHRDRARAWRIRRARRHPRSLRRRHRGAGAPRFLRRHAGIDPHLRSRHPAHHCDRTDAHRPVAGERDGADAGDDRPLPRALRRRCSAPPTATTCSTTRSARAGAHVGMEHWLPLSSTRLETLFDYVGEAPVVFDHLADEAVGERLDQIADHYEARQRRWSPATPAAARPTSRCRPTGSISTKREWNERRARAAGRAPVAVRPAGSAPTVVDIGGRAGRNFAAERNAEDVNVFDAVDRPHRRAQKAGKRVVVACWSEGSRDRMGQVLVDHGLTRLKPVADWREAEASPADMTALAVLGIEAGFETATLAVIGEQDILGDRLVRPHAKRRARRLPHRRHRPRRGRPRRPRRPRHRPLHRPEDHRGGRRAARLPRDPLRRQRPRLPAGREHRAPVALRLGGRRRAARQARRRRLAGAQGAAEEAHPRHGGGADQGRRGARHAHGAGDDPARGLYDEFAARFPYEETEDQQTAIDAVLTILPPARRWTG